MVSSRPVDVVDLIAAGMPDDAGIRSLWEKGAWQLLDPEGQSLVTILRSRTVESESDLRRWGWAQPEPGDDRARFVTEIYLAAGDGAARMAAAVASAVDGVILPGAATLETARPEEHSR
jgi:hypothetical protein